MKKTVLACCGFAASVGFADLKMQNIAHRGMWDKEVPQNTVEAIKRAYDSGATWVETDFHHTKAGQMVCMHAEGELRRYTGCAKKVRDLTPEDVATLNLGEGIVTHGTVSQLLKLYQMDAEGLLRHAVGLLDGETL